MLDIIIVNFTAAHMYNFLRLLLNFDENCTVTVFLKFAATFLLNSLYARSALLSYLD